MKSRSEVRELRATQKQMRAELARRIAEKKAEKAKLEQKDEEDTAAGALARAKAPLKAKPKIKQLAKVVGGKQNPHEVRAASADGPQGPEMNEQMYFEFFDAWLGRLPNAEAFRTAPLRKKDLGTSAMLEIDLRDEAAVQAALEKVGSQPNVGYLIGQSFELRRSAMLDRAYPVNEDNIRSWKRIAVYDPHPAVRLAAAERLQEVRLERVQKLTSNLKPVERAYFAKRDPHEKLTVDFMRLFATEGHHFFQTNIATPDGRYTNVGMLFPTPGMAHAAKEILREFGEQSGDEALLVQEVEAAEAARLQRAERLARPIELTDDDRVATEEEPKPDTPETEKWPEPKDQPSVLYFVNQTPLQQYTALQDRSVPANRENWHAWMSIYFSSASENIRRAAGRRAIEASPTYAVTKDYPELYRAAFMEYDPQHIASDFRAIRAFARGETFMRLGGSDGNVIMEIASKLLELYPEPDLAHTLEDRFWKRLLAARAAERFMLNFDGLDFSSEDTLAQGLEQLLKDTHSFEVAQWSRYMLYEVVKPPVEGSTQALVLKHLDQLESVHQGLKANLLDAQNDAELHQAITAALERRQSLHPTMAMMFNALLSDLEFRKTHAGEELDRVQADSAEAPKLAGQPEAFADIGYDPDASLESRVAAVSEHEVVVADVLMKGALTKWLKIADFDRSEIVRDQARAKIWAYEQPAIERATEDLRIHARRANQREDAIENMLQSSPRLPETHAILKSFRNELRSQDASEDDERLGFALDQLLLAYPAYSTP